MKNNESRRLTILTAGLILILILAMIVSSCGKTGNGDASSADTSVPALSEGNSEQTNVGDGSSIVNPPDTDAPGETSAEKSDTTADTVSAPDSETSAAPAGTTSAVTTVVPGTTTVPDATTTSADATTAVTSSETSSVTSAPVTSSAPTTTATPVTTGSPVATTTPVTEPQSPETTAHVHSFSDWKVETAATCTAAGTQVRTCSCGETETKSIAALGHKSVTDPAVAATPRGSGLSAGSHCEVCGAVITAQKTVYFTNYADPSLYASHYYYDYLGTLSKGKALQKLYEIFEADCLAFHSSGKNAEGEAGEYIVSSPNVTELGLTIEEAYSVWSVFRYDHPLYYWIKSSVGGLKTTIGSEVSYQVRLYCADEYASGSVRNSTNSKIYTGIADFMKNMKPESSDYMMAFQIHDAMAHKIDYAYSAPNVPEDAAWAHSIEGFFFHDSGVCECYAKTFQALMTLCGIDSIYVANDEHAWNMLKADDGKWYWVDATWDDAPNWKEGVCHLYFCVNDTEMIWRGYYNGESHTENFFSDPMHTLNLQASVGSGFTISLPARSTTPYSSTKHPIKVESFTVGHNEYYISGYDTVSVKKYYVSDVFPDTIEYSGRTYRIIKP